MEKTWTNVDGTPIEKATEVPIIWNPSREIEYGGRVVIYVTAYNNEIVMPHYVLVPGYKVGEYYQKDGCTSIQVLPIPEEDQSAIERLIAPLTQGAINFW